MYEYIAAGRRNKGRPKDEGTNTPEALSTYTLWLMMMMMMMMKMTKTTTMMMLMIMMTVQDYASLDRVLNCDTFDAT